MKKTVLLLDLVGYSTIARNIQNAQDARLVHYLNKQIQGFIEQGLTAIGASRAESEIANTGDGAILAFDSAQEAHDCAAAVHATTAEYNATIWQPLGKRVFRSGAATGEVDMMPLPTGGFESAGGAIGDAKGLEENATPGALIVDDHSFKALSTEQKARYEEGREIKGKREERYYAFECILNARGVDDVRHFTFIPLQNSNIHRRITEFFGRRSDLEEICEHLAHYPLLTRLLNIVT